MIKRVLNGRVLTRGYIMEISFLHPVYFWLVLLIPLFWFLPHRVSNKLQGILRSLALLAIIVGLARPVMLSSDASQYQVFILDKSASISSAQRDEQQSVVNELMAQVGAGDSVTQIILGEEPKNTTASQTSSEHTQIYINDGKNSSSLSTALQAAAEQIPDGTRGVVYLISDGLSTDRRWGSVAQSLIERGIPVNTYQLQVSGSDIYPAALRTSAELQVGQTTVLFVDVVGRSDSIQVKLMDGENELARVNNIKSDGRVSVPLEFEPKQTGFMNLRAEVVAASDNDVTNNQITSLFAVQKPVRVLYLGERMQQGAQKITELVGNGFQIEEPAADKALDESFPLANYDLVVVDDKPAAALTEGFQQKLVKQVSDNGLGLVFTGAKASFGAGGYYQSTLADILPVDFSQRDEKRDPSTALAVILDTSGSMGGLRLELAKQVTRLMIRRLKPHDRVGIVEFYGAKHWAVPMQPATNKIEIDRAIGRLQAIGGTVMLPGIEEAYYGLKNTNTRYKHILILTDAGVENADYETLIRSIVREGITVSTVLVGPEVHNQIMVDMSVWGKGRFYTVSDRYNLPELILKQISTTKLPAYQNGEFSLVSRGGQGWWGDIDRSAIPAVDGYVETTQKTGADVLLEIEGRKQPVLASWRYGLGRVTSLMTEPVGSATNSWKDWNDYGTFLGRVLTRTAADTKAFDYEIKRDDYRIEVIARRQIESTDVFPKADLIDSAGKSTQSLEFQQLSPGIFRSELVANPSDAVRVKTFSQDNDKSPGYLASTAYADVFPENQVDPAKSLDLIRLADVTGGHAMQAGNIKPSNARDLEAGASSMNLSKLWPYVVFLGLLIYLIELVYRRWPKKV
jgi:hypothetical protein